MWQQHAVTEFMTRKMQQQLLTQCLSTSRDSRDQQLFYNHCIYAMTSSDCLKKSVTYNCDYEVKLSQKEPDRKKTANAKFIYLIK